ncbi:GNAT family N-acetyltransferase [Paenibacillus sp. DYY-L-2]|uniref:GNAT family N-acetyltransferase n=1 Tax=Paenibacillus sp. DYY-L-2 TaxID=3447013 RepID=UPI003F4FFCF4
MHICEEKVTDYDAIDDLVASAFGGRRDESDLIARIRASEGYVPGLSLAAKTDDGKMAGHLMLSKAKVKSDDGLKEHEVLALAPVSVKPELQRQGVGGKLIKAAIGGAIEQGYELVLLIGHPEYYPRFGFVPARQHGLELRQFEVSDKVFMVCELQAGTLGRVRGELLYPPAFFD